jgi:hypothetical protein
MSKMKLSLCVINLALRHEGVWDSGYVWIDVLLNLARVGGERSASRPGRFTAGERVPSTH